MDLLNIPAGTNVMLGAPAEPMAADKLAALTELVSSIEGIAEAHVPQCFAIGVMDSPAQVLAVLIEESHQPEKILDTLNMGLSTIILSGDHLDVWPLSSGHAFLGDIRSANCRLYPQVESKPWWQLW